MSAREAETVVVGAGVIGLAVSYELLLRGRGVLLLERDLPGLAASRVAAGMLAPISEAEREESHRVELALDSKRRYPAFVAGLEARTGISCQYRTEGTLWVAVNRDQAEELEALEATLRAKGLALVRLTAPEVLAREPRLTGRVAAGLFVEEDHQLDPRALTRALEAAVRSLGGQIRGGFTVTDIPVTNGRVSSVRGVERAPGTGEGRAVEIGGETVVLAAGAWATETIRSPLADLGVRPVKGQMVRLRGEGLLRHVIRTPEVYFVPREDGELLVGTTMEEQGFQDAPTAGGVMDILRHAWLVLPGIYDLDVGELSAGFRPAVRDHAPVVGASGVPGLYAAIGHFRSGILFAPATAHYLAEEMVTGKMPAALAPFRAERLRDAARTAAR